MRAPQERQTTRDARLRRDADDRDLRALACRPQRGRSAGREGDDGRGIDIVGDLGGGRSYRMGGRVLGARLQRLDDRTVELVALGMAR